MAPAYASKRQPAALECAVSFDRVLAVFGAGWKVSARGAGAIVRRKKLAVETDEGEGQTLQHYAQTAVDFRRASRPKAPSSWRSAFLRSPYPASEASFLAITTRSQPSLPISSAAICRNLRFIRLRRTALPTLFPTENPNLLTSRPLGIAPSTRNPFALRLPFLRTRSKSRLLRSRRSLAAPFSSGLPFL